ncbi:MAG: transcription termination/antitermination protein NusA [Chloroflexaceae bacterium]|nr:transcription termination/antitermination protein NusA [Chloroflexaceae bacterium]
MKSDFYAAISQIASERGIPRDAIIGVMERALITAYKRTLGSNPPPMEVTVKLDPQTGLAHVYAEMQVVDEVMEEHLEIDLESARQFQSDVEIGDTILVEVKDTPRDFGRIAAQTAKQVVLQGIKEVEREYIYGEFIDREGQLMTATVQRTTRGNVILEIGKAEAVLPLKEQVESDRYFHNQRLKVYLLEVRRDETSGRGSRLVVSRVHKNLILRLFEVEVPEIHNGAVEIKSVAREPGLRTKVAVAARQEGIDPVGSCVGMRGFRIQNIVNELNGEKIDVVQWDPDAKEFIANALSPAQVVEVHLDDSERAAMVVVPDKQLSLAIGREGQNVRLAAKLTGWRIDIKSATTLLEEEREAAQAREAAEAEAMATEAALASAKVETRKVRPDGTVVYQNLHYGPLGDDLIGESVQLRATAAKLYIYFHDRLVASYILVDPEELDDSSTFADHPMTMADAELNGIEEQTSETEVESEAEEEVETDEA